MRLRQHKRIQYNKYQKEDEDQTITPVERRQLSQAKKESLKLERQNTRKKDKNASKSLNNLDYNQEDIQSRNMHIDIEKQLDNNKNLNIRESGNKYEILEQLKSGLASNTSINSISPNNQQNKGNQNQNFIKNYNKTNFNNNNTYQHNQKNKENNIQIDQKSIESDSIEQKQTPGSTTEDIIQISSESINQKEKNQQKDQENTINPQQHKQQPKEKIIILKSLNAANNHVKQIKKTIEQKQEIYNQLRQIHAPPKPQPEENQNQIKNEKQKEKQKTKNKSQQPKICPRCNKKLASKLNVERHIEFKHKELPYQCLNCDEQFSKKREVKIHLKMVKKCRKHYYERGIDYHEVRSVLDGTKEMIKMTPQQEEVLKMKYASYNQNLNQNNFNNKNNNNFSNFSNYNTNSNFNNCPKLNENSRPQFETGDFQNGIKKPENLVQSNSLLANEEHEQIQQEKLDNILPQNYNQQNDIYVSKSGNQLQLNKNESNSEILIPQTNQNLIPQQKENSELQAQNPLPILSFLNNNKNIQHNEQQKKIIINNNTGNNLIGQQDLQNNVQQQQQNGVFNHRASLKRRLKRVKADYSLELQLLRKRNKLKKINGCFEKAIDVIKQKQLLKFEEINNNINYNENYEDNEKENNNCQKNNIQTLNTQTSYYNKINLNLNPCKNIIQQEQIKMNGQKQKQKLQQQKQKAGWLGIYYGSVQNQIVKQIQSQVQIKEQSQDQLEDFMMENILKIYFKNSLNLN